MERTKLDPTCFISTLNSRTVYAFKIVKWQLYRTELKAFHWSLNHVSLSLSLYISCVDLLYIRQRFKLTLPHTRLTTPPTFLSSQGTYLVSSTIHLTEYGTDFWLIFPCTCYVWHERPVHLSKSDIKQRVDNAQSNRLPDEISTQHTQSTLEKIINDDLLTSLVLPHWFEKLFDPPERYSPDICCT